MPRTANHTRQRILDAAYGLFYRKGFTRVGVDAVAEKAGVTKRTLYDHFASKDDLLAAVLRFHHELAIARITSWSARLSGDLDTLLDSLFSELAQWAASPRWSGPGFTRLAMELADLPGHPARAIARRHKAALEAWLGGELAGRGLAAPAECAREVMLLLEGSMSLMLIHGDRGVAKVAAQAAKHLMSVRMRKGTAVDHR